MDVAVLVKRVPDPEARVSVQAGALAVEEKWVMGFFDEIAVEQALRMKGALGGKVVVLTAGPAACDETVRKGVAMGADRAVRVDVPAAAGDPLLRARALAAAVKKAGAGVVLCGKQSGDEEAGFTGPAVAAILGIPCVAGVLALEPSAAGAKGRREVEGGSEAFEVGWPAVLTAAKGLAAPRTPPVMGVMKAMRAPVEVWNEAALGLAGSKALFEKPAFEAPRARGKVRMIPGTPQEAARELVRILKSEAKVL
jgi:electron transfer flavoprotein beta subunit